MKWRVKQKNLCSEIWVRTRYWELPIVCFENDFKGKVWRGRRFNFCFEIVKRNLAFPARRLGFSLLDRFDDLTPSDSHRPMRILRRNFATVIQACCNYRGGEKNTFSATGSPGKDGAKTALSYNRNMNRLWRIAQKLDKAPFWRAFRTSFSSDYHR